MTQCVSLLLIIDSYNDSVALSCLGKLYISQTDRAWLAGGKVLGLTVSRRYLLQLQSLLAVPSLQPVESYRTQCTISSSDKL